MCLCNDTHVTNRNAGAFVTTSEIELKFASRVVFHHFAKFIFIVHVSFPCLEDIPDVTTDVLRNVGVADFSMDIDAGTFSLARI